MSSSVVLPQFVKVLTKDDCLSDEMCICSKFCDRFGHRVANLLKLKIRNGYKILVGLDPDDCVLVGMDKFFQDFGLKGGETLVFQFRDPKCFNVCIIGSDGVEIDYPSIVHGSQNCNPRSVKVDRGGWKFLKSVLCTEDLIDEIVPPTSFLSKFGSTIPSQFGFLMTNGKRFPGVFSRRDSTFSGLSGICAALGLPNLNSFDILFFTYDGVGNFLVSLFDGLNIEILFDDELVASGEILERITRPNQFVVEVQPFHMLDYCHGVDVPAEFRGLCDRWDRKDHITVYVDDHSWVLEIRKRPGWKRTTIHGGWVQFREALDLKIGDRCVFKWTDRNCHKFTVTVLKAVDVID